MEKNIEDFILMEWLINPEEPLKVTAEKIDKLIHELANYSIENYNKAICDKDYSKFELLDTLAHSIDELVLAEIVIKLKAEIFDFLVIYNKLNW